MPLNDLEDQMLEHVRNMIQRGLVYIYADMSKRNITSGTPPAPPELKLVIGETTTTGHYPAVRISMPTPYETAWLATGVRNDRYTVNVDVDMRSSKKETKNKAIQGISNAIKNWMLHRPNLSGTVFQTQVGYYNSWCEATTLGSKGDGSIRTARFSWWAMVANSYYYAGAEA